MEKLEKQAIELLNLKENCLIKSKEMKIFTLTDRAA